MRERDCGMWEEHYLIGRKAPSRYNAWKCSDGVQVSVDGIARLKTAVPTLAFSAYDTDKIVVFLNNMMGEFTAKSWLCILAKLGVHGA